MPDICLPAKGNTVKYQNGLLQQEAKKEKVQGDPLRKMGCRYLPSKCNLLNRKNLTL
jgi:hypothetical protein